MYAGPNRVRGSTVRGAAVAARGRRPVITITAHDLPALYDGDVLSASGDKVGSVGQFYVDDQTGEPTFVTANAGLFGTSSSFVPLRGARADQGNVVVAFDRTTVKDSPRVEDDGSLTPAEEDRLYAYYGLSGRAADAADYGVADQVPVPGTARAGDPNRAGSSGRPRAQEPV